jgi:hypothetical protein
MARAEGIAEQGISTGIFAAAHESATGSTLVPRANAAARPQLAKADFASSSQHVREGQRIAELEAEIDALQPQALALGAEPTADVPPWVLLGVRIAARRERAA